MDTNSQNHGNNTCGEKHPVPLQVNTQRSAVLRDVSTFLKNFIFTSKRQRQYVFQIQFCILAQNHNMNSDTLI